MIITVAIFTFVSNFSLMFEAYSIETQTYLFTPGFRAIFSQFNWFTLILTGILAIGIFTFVINAWVAFKKKDIAIMKGIGMLPSKGYSIFMAEILILTLGGYLIGNIVGFGVYLILFVMLDEGGFHAQFQIAWLANLIFLAIVLIAIIGTSGYKLTKIIEKQTVGEALAGDIPFSTYARSKHNFLLRYLCKLGTSVKIAIRGLIRRRYDFRRTFAFLTVVGMLLFTSTIAPVSLNANVQGYLQSSINEDTIIIGHSELLPYIVRTYTQFSDSSQAVSYGDRDFSPPEFFFPRDKLASFQSSNDIIAIDGCVFLLEPFKEMQGVRFLDGGCDLPCMTEVFIGQHREGTAVIMGINASNPSSIFPQNEYAATYEMGNITIGDGIQYGYTDDYSIQQLKIHEKDFWMSNVVMDPCYNGRTVYMGIAALWDLWDEHNSTFNLIFVRSTPEAHEGLITVLDTLAKTVLGPAFAAMSLRAAMRSNAVALFSVQTYFIILAVIIFGIALIAISDYHKGASHYKIKDLLIMRLLGAKRSFQMKCYYWETLLLLFPSLGLAFSLGMIFVEWFLISDLRFLPPLWVPLSIATVFFGIFAVLNYFISKLLVGRAHGTPSLVLQ